MTNTFDWFDLLIDVICKRIEEGDPAAAAYLRTRIEAAFVPNRTVELLGECMGNLTARAEAAEARLREWQECALYDATMEGPVFKGWDRSALDRCRRQALGAEHE